MSVSFKDFQGRFQNPINNAEKVELIVKYNGDIFQVSEDLGATVEILSPNYAILTIEFDKIPYLFNYTEIEHIEPPKTLTLNLNQAINKSCVYNVRNQNGTELTGENVLIAVLDSGIDYTHKDFINEDGTSRILYMWDQTILGNPPSGFSFGSEYTNAQINEALSLDDPYKLVSEIDSIGHGTAVCGIAAGNGRSSGGKNIGVAPKASLIIVKLGEPGYPYFALNTQIMRALKYVMDKAMELNMPLAVNISYGTNDGAHNGQSLFERFINNIAEKWKTSIIVASGNEGDSGHHYFGKIGENEVQDIEFFYSGKYSSFYITLWKNFVDEFSVELILPNGNSTGFVSYYSTTRNYRIGNVSIFINYGQPQFYNSFQEIFFKIDSDNLENIIGLFTIKIKSEKIVDGKYDIYLPTVEEAGTQTTFVSPEENVTLTIPSTAQNVITVGGYDSERSIIASFSGRGNTLNVVFQKPDLVAPAVNILTTAINGGYSVFSGTSMAAPFVTGATALLMQWGIIDKNDPFLYGERLKAYLKSGTNKFLNNIDYPNTRWGYGALCLSKTLNKLKTFNGYR